MMTFDLKMVRMDFHRYVERCEKMRLKNSDIDGCIITFQLEGSELRDMRLREMQVLLQVR